MLMFKMYQDLAAILHMMNGHLDLDTVLDRQLKW